MDEVTVVDLRESTRSNADALTDVVALEAIHGHPWQLMTTAELAAALDVDDDEAAARIATLMKAGYLYGPMQYRSIGGEWSAIGFKLTDNGRCLLGVEAACDGWSRALEARNTAPVDTGSHPGAGHLGVGGNLRRRHARRPRASNPAIARDG